MLSSASVESLELPISSGRRLARSTMRRLARVLSELFAPPFALCGLVVLLSTRTAAPNYWHTADLYLLFALIVPLGVLIYERHAGRLSDLHMNDRRERIRPFFISVLGAAAGWLSVQLVVGPTVIDRIASAHLASATLLFLITIRWKVSIHAATIAGVSVVLVREIDFAPSLGAVLTCAVCWARVYLGRHEVLQTVVGAGIGGLAFLLF